METLGWSWQKALKESGLNMGEIVYVWMTTLMHLAVNSEIIKKLFMNYEIEYVGVHLLDIA